MAAFDGEQMLTATRSCKWVGVLRGVSRVLPEPVLCACYDGVSRHHELCAVDSSVELLDTPNIKVAWWNGLSVQERKPPRGGGAHLCGNQQESGALGGFFSIRGRSRLPRGTGIAKPSSWRRVDGVRGKL